MKANGFPPGSESVALHELHRIAKDKTHNAKQQARELVSSRVRGGVTGSTGAPSSSADVISIPGAGGTAPKPAYEPGWVLDEEFTPWIFGEDGKLRAPTEDEITELDSHIAKAGGGKKGLEAVVRPASEFAALKEASDKTTSSGLVAEARAKASDVPLPERKPTLASGAKEIGYGVVNPRIGLQMLKNEFKKKKPPPPPEEPPTLPILDEMLEQVP